MDVRCPHCGKKLGNRVVGIYETDCPRCHRRVRFVRHGHEIVTFEGQSYTVAAALTGVADATDPIRFTGVYSPAKGVTGA